MKKYWQPIHPGWVENIEPFPSHYASMISPLWGRLSEDNQVPVYYGTRNEKQTCAMCDRSPPEVSFRSTSHLLAAAVGNRALRSNEECDDCNTKIFSKHEDELAKWLLPYRVIGQVRRRKGYPEISSGEETSIQWDKQTKQIKIQTDLSNIEDVINFTGGNSAELPMDAPSYLPYPAIKSLIRSAWLAMKPEQRQNAKYLRQIIQDQVSLSRVQWLEWLFPVKLDAFIFEIWEKKPESSIISSPFVIRLMMANYCIVWCCPDTVTNQHIPSLLPLFESSIAPTGVEFLLSAAEDLSRRIERPNFHFKFTFGELIRGA